MNIPALDMGLFDQNYQEPDITDTEEKLVNYNNLQRIAWLSEGLRVAKAIGRVVTPDVFGTGWLIGDNLIITNHHVIGHDPEPNTCWIEFNYETNWKGEPTAVDRYNIVKLLKTRTVEEQLDYSIFEVEGRPGEKYGFIDIKDAKKPSLDSAASFYPVIIQHPGGGFKQVALTDNHLKAVSDVFCWYTTDTENGTSGAAVFDQRWRPIALHHAGGPHKIANGSIQILNEGILLANIVADAVSVLGKTTEHVRVAMKDLLKAGHFASSIPTPRPSFGWYIDNPRINNAIKLDAKGDAERAPLIAAAAGIAVRAATHWVLSTGTRSIFMNDGFIANIAPDETQAQVFDKVYDSLLKDHKATLATLAQRADHYEVAPQAAAFLAGLATEATVTPA